MGGLEGARPPGVQWGTPDVALPPGSAAGPTNLVATLTARFPMTTAAGERRAAFLQYFFLVGGSTEAVVSFGSIDAPLADVLTSRAVKAVAERVAAL